MYSARGQTSTHEMQQLSNPARITRTRSAPFSRSAGVLLATVCAILVAGCSAPTTSASTSTTTRPTGSHVVLTLADNGRHVIVGKDALIEAALPYSNSSINRWKLVTSGPGIREISMNTSSTGTHSRPMQDFSFKWTRTSPFGLVFFLETPGHGGKLVQEFAVVLDSNTNPQTHPAKKSTSGSHK
jgi:hypothetical protein